MAETDQEPLKERMREALSDAGMKVSDLAAATGDSDKQTRRWVTGATTVPADYLTRFVGAVPGVSAEWLLRGGDKKPAPQEGRRASAEPIADAERIGLLGMLADVQRALAEGRPAEPRVVSWDRLQQAGSAYSIFRRQAPATPPGGMSNETRESPDPPPSGE